MPHPSKRELRLGITELPDAECCLIKTMLRLFRYDPDFRWVYAESPPYDALVSGGRPVSAETTDAVLYILSSAEHPSVAADRQDVLIRPIRSDRLEAWLVRIDRTRAAEPPGAAGTAEPRQEPAASAPPSNSAFDARFRLKRWPPPSLLHGDPARIRLATLLSRRALSHAELASLSGSHPDACRTFLWVLQSAALLVPVPTTGATVPAPAETGSVMNRLISGIRRALFS